VSSELSREEEEEEGFESDRKVNIDSLSPTKVGKNVRAVTLKRSKKHKKGVVTKLEKNVFVKLNTFSRNELAKEKIEGQKGSFLKGSTFLSKPDNPMLNMLSPFVSKSVSRVH
jgi:hypothetical protein